MTALVWPHRSRKSQAALPFGHGCGWENLPLAGSGRGLAYAVRLAANMRGYANHFAICRCGTCRKHDAPVILKPVEQQLNQKKIT